MLKIILLCPEPPDVLIDKMMLAATEDGIEIDILPMQLNNMNFSKRNGDMILLSPRMRHVKNEVCKQIGNIIPVEIIDTIDYGTMNGRAVLETVKKSLKM